jgi:tripartite ATP-independent transporter DctM subunit
MALSLTVFCWLRPDMAPRTSDFDTSWKAKFDSLKGLWGALLLIIVVIGSIYSGWATPDEAAAVGVVGALLIIWMRGKFNFKLIRLATEDSAIVSAMIFLILGAGFIFSTFLSSTGVITILATWVVDLKMPFYLLMFAIVVLYLILGCFLDAISMMVLTMPVLAPIIVSMDGNLIWFGVIVTMMMAIGAITPPLGLNCFVMKGALGDTVELRDIFMGSLPFVGVMLFTVGILIAFPQISLWLPELMKSSRF